MTLEIRALDAADIAAETEALARILVESVGLNAAIGFMAPLPRARAAAFWSEDVAQEVAAGRRILFGAVREGELVGTVQLITAMPPNQPHRCEIAKMIVDPSARRLGIGRALMEAALARGRALGKTLVTLDTRTGDAGERLYASVGFATAGIVPDFAWDADGTKTHATTYMYRAL